MAGNGAREEEAGGEISMASLVETVEDVSVAVPPPRPPRQQQATTSVETADDENLFGIGPDGVPRRKRLRRNKAATARPRRSPCNADSSSRPPSREASIRRAQTDVMTTVRSASRRAVGGGRPAQTKSAPGRKSGRADHASHAREP